MKEGVLKEIQRMKNAFLRSWYRLRALKSLTKLYVWSKTLKDPEDRELAIKCYHIAHYRYTQHWGEPLWRN